MGLAHGGGWTPPRGHSIGMCIRGQDHLGASKHPSTMHRPCPLALLFPRGLCQERVALHRHRRGAASAMCLAATNLWLNQGGRAREAGRRFWRLVLGPPRGGAHLDRHTRRARRRPTRQSRLGGPSPAVWPGRPYAAAPPPHLWLRHAARVRAGRVPKRRGLPHPPHAERRGARASGVVGPPKMPATRLVPPPPPPPAPPPLQQRSPPSFPAEALSRAADPPPTPHQGGCTRPRRGPHPACAAETDSRRGPPTVGTHSGLGGALGRVAHRRPCARAVVGQRPAR